MHLHLSWKKIVPLCILCLLLTAGCGESKNGDSAPAFSLKEITGETVSLDQYKGQIVLLDFWATWCPPCKKSIPELITLQSKYKEQGLVVLGISLDDPNRVSDSDLASFKKHYKINYKILRGNAEVVKDYFGKQSISIPTMFFINPEGKIVDKHVGFMPGAIEASLKKMLS